MILSFSILFCVCILLEMSANKIFSDLKTQSIAIADTQTHLIPSLGALP